MKTQIQTYLFLFLSMILLAGCNRNDEPEFQDTDRNNLILKFDNIIENQGPVKLNSTTLTTASGQQIQFSKLKYIISDVILTKADGSEFIYHLKNPDLGAYIVDAAEPALTHNFILKDIPAGDYRAVSFGIGIAPEAYILGQNSQAVFWDKAKASGMNWSWASGYKFINLEGKFGPAETDKFQIHTGNIGNPSVSQTSDVFRRVKITFPQTAKVRKNIQPQVHIMARINRLFDIPQKIEIHSGNAIAMHPSKELVQKITENIQGVFYIDHVHND